MTDTALIEEIKLLGEFEAEKNNLAKASLVRIKKDRTCIECGKTITSGTKAITASHMTDKRYNVTLRELFTYDFVDETNFSFVPVRHWMCTCCADKIVNKHIQRRKEAFNKQSNLKICRNRNNLESLYKNGEITAKEWDDIEMAEIHQYAFEEVVGIGQA